MRLGSGVRQGVAFANEALAGSSLNYRPAFIVGKGQTVREDKAMSTFQNRGSSALLVIDVQNGVVDNAFSRDGVIATIHEVIAKAREKNVPVIWVQHSDEELVIDSDAWQIVPELVP